MLNHVIKCLGVITMALTGIGCAGLPNPLDGDAAGPTQRADPRFYSSIAYAPASVPCCGTAATPVAATPRPSNVKPGEVWCYVKIAGEVRTREERRITCQGRWEWQRSASCEVPGAEPAATQAPQKRAELASGVSPGEVWCSVWIPPTYETRTIQEPAGCDRWEWRRTSECEVPDTAK